MIPIKEAINSGAWLHFSDNKEELAFRLKILSFKKLNLMEVDQPENVETNEGAQWWLLNIELINLTKFTIKHYHWKDSIQLIDSDGFKFNYKSDSHLGLYSEFSKKSGLNIFFAGEYIPKIKYKGAIAFLLPDEPEAKYSISMKDGSVHEA